MVDVNRHAALFNKIRKDAVVCNDKEIGFRIQDEDFCFPSKTANHMTLKNGDIVFINAMWSDDRYPDAKQIRDKTARRLRKVGYDVESSTWDFTDLARCRSYKIEATNKKWEFNPRGGWKKTL